MNGKLFKIEMEIFPSKKKINKKKLDITTHLVVN